jgi:hypothetical protein
MYYGYNPYRPIERAAESLGRSLERMGERRSQHATRMGGLALTERRLGMEEKRLGMEEARLSLEERARMPAIREAERVEQETVDRQARMREPSDLRTPQGWEEELGFDNEKGLYWYNKALKKYGKERLDNLTRGEEAEVIVGSLLADPNPKDLILQRKSLNLAIEKYLEAGAKPDGRDEKSLKLKRMMGRLQFVEQGFQAARKNPAAYAGWLVMTTPKPTPEQIKAGVKDPLSKEIRETGEAHNRKQTALTAAQARGSGLTVKQQRDLEAKAGARVTKILGLSEWNKLDEKTQVLALDASARAEKYVRQGMGQAEAVKRALDEDPKFIGLRIKKDFPNAYEDPPKSNQWYVDTEEGKQPIRRIQ